MKNQGGLTTFPYKSVLDLSQLINYWKVNLKSNNVFSGYPADHILERIDQNPQLSKPVNNIDELQKDKELLGLLMSAIFPPAFVETDLVAALVPFDISGFYATPGYREIFPDGKMRKDLKINTPDNNFMTGKIINAGIQILNKFYDTNIELEKPILVKVPDKKHSELEKVYKINIDTQFTDVVKKGNLPPLTKKDIRKLIDDIYNTELWLKHLPPEKFEFHGFGIVRLIDVTVEEMLSSIKYDLLKKDAVTCGRSFGTIQQKIKSIFRLPQLKMGISYFDPQDNIVSNYGAEDWKSFLITDQEENLSCDCFTGSIYDLAYNQKRPVIIENLEEHPRKTTIEKHLLQKGIKNIA
ncbi:MAG: hypothetical protein R3345_11525, partial [Fulvivirga sp.]|nr:hypothetical protein [Fulvivirga sp.]